MRTTVRLDDELLAQLRQRAALEQRSLTAVLDATLRSGLRAGSRRPRTRQPYREKPVALGTPHFDLTKSLALAAALEDEEVVRKVALRK